MPAQRLHPHAAGLMRSLLFVPADSPPKLAKALSCGADALILDLEDSVASARKEAARAGAAAFLAQTALQQKRPRLIVRINGLGSGLTDADLDAVVPSRPDAIMLPKAEGGASVIHVDAKLCAREALSGLAERTIAIVPIATETARSLFAAGTYRDASPRLLALTWGAEDLATDLGAEANRDGHGQLLDAYRLARTLCIAAAAAAGVPAIDTVYVDFRNDAGLRRECEDARRDGFTGKMAIHPGQVATINDVFTPGPDAIARAQAIIAAFAAAPGAGVVGIDGVMFDRPHLTKAERLLARAKAEGLA
jgi:citrate lyase subunit beta/citryl-CoA lyase